MPDRLHGRPGSRGPSRISLLRPEELDEERARLHADIAEGPRRAQAVVPLLDEDGRLLGPFGLMLLAPRIGSAVQGVGAALRFDDTLDVRSRELAILTVAALRRSEFEWLAHEQAALAAGLTAAQLQAVLDGESPAGLGAHEQIVVGTVRCLVADGELDDGHYVAATSALGETGLAALVWLVGYYQMLAIALATFRPPLPAAARS